MLSRQRESGFPDIAYDTFTKKVRANPFPPRRSLTRTNALSSNITAA
jgi:hypothetical protein